MKYGQTKHCYLLKYVGILCLYPGNLLLNRHYSLPDETNDQFIFRAAILGTIWHSNDVLTLHTYTYKYILYIYNQQPLGCIVPLDRVSERVEGQFVRVAYLYIYGGDFSQHRRQGKVRVELDSAPSVLPRFNRREMIPESR